MIFTCVCQAWLHIVVQVPRADMYTTEQSAVADAMTAVKAAWHCDDYGTCFMDGRRDHIEINRFRLMAWASAVVSTSLFL